MGTVSYQARIILNSGEKWDFSQSQNGTKILRVNLAETHRMRKDRAKKDPKMAKYVAAAPAVPDDGYINTTTSWHRLTIIGDIAEELALNPDFNKNALIDVTGAQYTEEHPWVTKDNVSRAGRPETLGDKSDGGVSIKFPPRIDDEHPALPPIWDGESTIASAGGGGAPQMREIDEETEGF